MILKKYFLIIGICTLLLLINPKIEQPNIYSSAVLENKSTICNSNNLYPDIFLTFLKPYTDTSINDFYKDYLTISPIEDPWHVKIIGIQSPKHLEFIIKLEVAPYIGPHNSVGIDHITFKLKSSGEVSIDKFEHIKSFEIAPNYQKFIKSWPPE